MIKTNRLKSICYSRKKLDEYFGKNKKIIMNLLLKITRNNDEYQYLYETDGIFEGMEVSNYNIGYLKI
ncbi:MAG: hypothetical protein L6V81_05555 [Clostridium sp.]|nr:MAG: hypothetical protein L6V81_05555 [Clostridium sp.]